MFTRRTLVRGAAAGVVAASWNDRTQAHAQIFSKTVRIVVGFPAGGGTDVLARILAEKLHASRPNTSRMRKLTAASCCSRPISR
jgi:tripartite-type tricarboxylate transporter receptor subunit TctC